MKSYQAYSTTSNCTDVRLTLSNKNKLHRKEFCHKGNITVAQKHLHYMLKRTLQLGVNFVLLRYPTRNLQCLNAPGVFFKYLSVDYINICRAVFLSRCHHVICSDIVHRSLWNVKLDLHLVPTGIFLFFRLLIISGKNSQ